MAKEQNKVLNFLYRHDFSKSELFRVKDEPLDLSKPKNLTSRCTFAKYHDKSTTKDEAEKLGSRGFAYLGVFGGISNYSKVIDLKKYGDGKVGRPRKPKTVVDLKVCSSRKHRRKGHGRSSCNISLTGCPSNAEDTHNNAASLEEEIKERRKKSIKAKLSVKKEHLLTADEEQDIHTRADIYALTTIPDPNFYITPDDDQKPSRPASSIDESHVNTVFPAVKKKRRRNYGNSNCYVTYHNTEDIFDNTKMLPLGTRLIKPPTKLVELVAQAIHGSPDGLLQVQQIYTYLQNRYPFFRYMERTSVNSWRSSIRHALYQKWFRKIRFDLACISCKGCYWAINHMIKPKEWTMPENSIWISAVTEDDVHPMTTLELNSITHNEILGSVTHSEILSLMRDEKSDGDFTESILAAAKDFGIEIEDSDLIPMEEEEERKDNQGEGEKVKQCDPVLAMCAPELLHEDVYFSNTDSSGHDSASPLLESPIPTSRLEHLHDINSNKQKSKRKQSSPVQNPSVFSPVINWTPNWDEYGSYILSPQSSHHSIFGVQNVKQSDRSSYRLEENNRNIEAQNNYKSIMADLNDILSYSHSPNMSSNSPSLSDIGEVNSDIEIIAEFPKVDTDCMDGFDFADV